MPINKKYLATFEEEKFYHIYSKAIGDQKLFLNDENKRFFLQKYSIYTSSYFETYAYNLLDNHFHFLVKTKSINNLNKNLQQLESSKIKQHQIKYLNHKISFDIELELQFKDLLISYAQAFNKANKRVGPLFINPFKRVFVNDETHLTSLIIYIHANTAKHKLDKNFESYPWSSYKSILSDSVTLLKRDEVLNWFGNKENFIKVHKENSDYYYNDFAIEE
jgi:putative transposase